MAQNDIERYLWGIAPAMSLEEFVKAITAYKDKAVEEAKPLITTKETLQLIAYQANNQPDEFKNLAVEIAYRIDKENTELAQYILAQYRLIPTFEITD